MTELVDNTLAAHGKNGIFKIPLSILQRLVAQVAQRATELNDPVMNRIMFDMNLYELPSPTSPEYGKIMKEVYAKEKAYLQAISTFSKKVEKD